MKSSMFAKWTESLFLLWIMPPAKMPLRDGTRLWNALRVGSRNNMTEILIILFGALTVALTIVCIVLVMSLKKNKNDAAIYEEFRRNREEMARSSKESRDDTTAALGKIENKLNDMLKENYQSRIDLTEKIGASLKSIQEQNAQSSEKQARVVNESIARMQESNEKKLEEMRVTVDEKLTSTLTTRLNSSFKTVSEQLENVYKSLGEMKELSQGVTTNVTSLNRVLTNVKARGTWAEVQLEAILDQTIPGLYVKNYSPKNNAERVEFAIRFPNSDKNGEDVYLPIDSKFPLEDYVRVCDAADNADPEALRIARKALEDRVLAEAKDIKKYICVPQTTPFAVLYLATEGLYAEIASSKTGIAEKLQAQNVMIAGPSTITALLNSFAMGFKAMAINEKADEVRKLLSVAKSQYETFGVTLEKARKKIDEAGKSLDEAQKRNEIINKKLKGVEEIESSSAEQFFEIEE
ncbi:MAG: DNA recombination protein RmuC [Ruminococcaceae bacterium]|nr:DNA recombination protein RmuC [Oscillospiraceae bacterium]